MTSRVLLEAGYSTNMEYLYIGYQPGIHKARFSPDWYSTIGKQEQIGAGVTTQFGAWDGRVSPASGIDPKKYVISSALSYVTGSHSFKTGFQWGFGSYVLEYDINADLVQLYRNGRPDSVRVYNTPVRSEEFLNGDFGIYAQDSWTLHRLTVTPGVRLEVFRGQISNQDVAPGRFVPVRHFDQTPCLPCWLDVTPRLGVAYDVFGNARTALKVTANRYMAGQTLSYAHRYNPLALQSDTRTWNDLNGDNVAQENEIGPSNNTRFGLPVFTRRPDADLKREYDWEYSAGIQHELIRGMSVTAVWYHRNTYDMTRSINGPFGPQDYSIVNVVSPLDGSIIPAYNLNPAKRGLIDRVDVNSDDSSLRAYSYDGLEFGAAARFAGATLFGGWTIDRRILDHCDELENWGNLSGVIYAASGLNSLQPKSDYHFCNQSDLGIPYLHEFKLSGSYLLPWNVQVNAAIQSYPGPTLPTRWSIGRTTRYAAGCIGPCTPGALVIPNMTATTYVLDLTPPGSDFYGRLTQLDLGVRKIFRVRNYQLSGQMDLFNFLNSSYLKSQTTTWGPALGRPLSTLQPRTLRLAMQMRF
jgi:hypothetical protein